MIERILHTVVHTAADKQQALATLLPLVANREPPALQVVLRLLKACFQQCERTLSQDAACLRYQDTVVDQTLRLLTKCLGHSSSAVRKNAVDGLVAFHFALQDNDNDDDNALVPAFLAAHADEMQQRLVAIFIDRATMDRHHVRRAS